MACLTASLEDRNDSFGFIKLEISQILEMGVNGWHLSFLII